MKMLNTKRFSPASRPSLILSALLVAGLGSAASARGGEHTDFPDLSIKPPNKGGGGYQAPKKIFDAIIGVITDSEGNVIQDNGIVAPLPPTFPPKPTLPEHGFSVTPSVSFGAGEPIGSNFSSVPTPGAGGLMIVGAAAAGLRRRRR